MQILAVCFFGFFPFACVGELEVLVDHVGYETRSTKHALVLGTEQDHPQKFSLVDAATGNSVMSGTLST